MTQPNCSCGEASKKKILIYACSGAANVAEIADRVARKLMSDGYGAMFCLAGLGADLPNMIQTAKEADLNLVLDGCPLDCAKLIFKKHGLENIKIIRVTDLGIVKAKGVKITDDQVNIVYNEALKALA